MVLPDGLGASGVIMLTNIDVHGALIPIIGYQ